jgi:hypothetical protein
MTFGGSTLVSLHRAGTDKPSWVEVGESIDGYQLVRLDTDSGCVTLTDGSRTFALQIVDEGKTGVSGLVAAAGGTSVGEKRTFEQLSPGEQRYYYDNPDKVPDLNRKGIRIPGKLAYAYAQYARGQGAGSSGIEATDEAKQQPASTRASLVEAARKRAESSSNKRERYPVPLIDVGYTREERLEAAALAAGK